MTSLFTVILAGGGGTRLWPLSRDLYPKQFLSFNDKESMLQLTLKRLEGLTSDQSMFKPLVVCNEEHRFLVEEHASQIGVELDSIVLEPTGRNTAPALTIAALLVKEKDPIILMMPADHLIEDTTGFQNAVKTGMQLAEEGILVTFGIKPTHPETGYGYIKMAAQLNQEGESSAYLIEEFVEKPDADTAEKYLQTNEYLWNSGIFMMKASVWLQAIGKYREDILTACIKAFANGVDDGIFYRLDKEAFLSCPSDSIDYAVMEKICEDDEYEAALVELY
ncbi:MAG: mannose-1-phosphate guanylyltransferase/mannose-6-phosphate isomerase, partial [Gammaproteobacteria bacterium]